MTDSNIIYSDVIGVEKWRNGLLQSQGFTDNDSEE